MSHTRGRLAAVLRRAAAPLIVLGGGAAVLFGLSLLPGKERGEPKVDAPVVNVTVVQVEPIAELQDTFRLKGTVEPWATVRLSAETDGRIQRITAREGQLILPNQPLVCLERDLLEATVAQAAARARFDARELKRVQQAWQEKVVTEMEVDAASSAADVSKASWDFAKAQLRRTVIRAPERIENGNGSADVLGLLNDLPVEVGEYVQGGTLVAEIVDSSFVKVMADVPERDIRYLHVGDEVAVVIEAVNDRRLSGAIHFIKATADERTRTFRTEIKVANPEGDIRAGMIVEVHLLREVRRNVTMIPLSAVIPLEKGYEVYVSNDGTAHRRQVSLGAIRGRAVEVLPPASGEGLRSGDRLIVKGQRLVGDGQRIVEQPEPHVLLDRADGPPTTTASQPTDGSATTDPGAK